MKLIVCVDKENGILFNHRRVSRDREIIADLLKEEEQIKILESSKNLFGESEKVEVCSDFNPEDTIFWEDTIPQDFPIDELIVYRFDKVYPSDVKLNIDLSQLDLESVEVIPGYSHTEILKEVYRV